MCVSQECENEGEMSWPQQLQIHVYVAYFFSLKQNIIIHQLFDHQASIYVIYIRGHLTEAYESLDARHETRLTLNEPT